MHLHPTAVIDLETTGFRHTDRILEIGVVLLDRDLHVEGTWQTLLQPGLEIDNTHVHDIRTTDLIHAPKFRGVARELAELLDGRVVIAHNAAFDTKFLAAEFQRIGVDLPLEGSWALCTRRLSRELLPGAPERLAMCLETLGLEGDRPHTALGGAEATADLYRELAVRYKIEAPGVRPLQLRELLLPVTEGLETEKLLVRDSERTEAGSWLERLSDHVPATGVMAVDEYRSRLRAALLDGELSQAEIENLIGAAQNLGLSREEALELHGDYLRQLAIEMWADGVVTPEERAYIHDIALQLAVPATEVDTLLAAPLSGNGTRIGLRPGDRVAFTGVLDLGRDTWESRAFAAGLSVGGVTEASALLVSADPDSMSGKARRAREFGVQIIDEATFARLLHEVEEDRDVATGDGAELRLEDLLSSPAKEAISATTPATTVIPAWYREVFPWLEDLGEAVSGTEDITEKWIRYFRFQPLYELSPRLRPHELPEGVDVGGMLMNRWVHAHPEPLRASLLEIEDLSGVGPSTALKIVSATVLAALDAAPPVVETAGLYLDQDGEVELWDGDIERAENPGFSRHSDPVAEAIRTLAEWWWLIEGQLPLPAGPVPEAVAQATSRLGSGPFWSDPAASMVRRAISEITEQVGSDQRDQDIFSDRLLGEANLESLGNRHGVTRERIRQLEAKLKDRIAEPGPATQMLLDGLLRRFGPLRQRSEILHTLPKLGEPGPAVGRSMLMTLNYLASDWELTDRWFQRRGFAAELAGALEKLADNYGVVEIAELATELDVDLELIRSRLAEEPESSLLVLDNKVLTRIGKYGDRGAAIIAIAGEPLTGPEIIDRYGSGNARSLSNALSLDERVNRVSRDTWALAEWGREEYTTLVGWIAKRVDEAGSLPIEELLKEATEVLGAAPTSVRAYASTAEFQTVDGMVSRVDEIPEDWPDPHESAGLYRMEEGWALLATVNFDHLRGSGSNVPSGIATVLEIPMLEKRMLDSPLGEQMISRTRTGMAMGSIRRFLQELGSVEGDRVWVDFSREGYFEVRPATPRRESLTGLPELLNQMGLDDEVREDDPAPLVKVNEALGLNGNAPRRRTVSRFRHRRQDELAELVAEL